MGIHPDQLLSENNNNCAHNLSRRAHCEQCLVSKKKSITMLLSSLPIQIGSIKALKCIQSTSGNCWVPPFLTAFIICRSIFFVFFRVKHGDASVLWIIDEYQSYDLPSTTHLIAEDPSGPEGPRLVFRLIEVMTSRYNHSNGHQPDSRPANGICMPCPDTRLTLHAGNYYT